MEFRDFKVRLNEFCKMKGFTLVSDEMRYVSFKTPRGKKIHCSGSSMHSIMLHHGIK